MNCETYIPIDETLSAPLVRILRALRHFEWVTTTDLLLVLGVSERGREHNTLHRALSRACTTGYIATRGPARNYREYMITPSGRAELKRRLTVDMECAA